MYRVQYASAEIRFRSRWLGRACVRWGLLRCHAPYQYKKDRPKRLKVGQWFCPDLMDRFILHIIIHNLRIDWILELGSFHHKQTILRLDFGSNNDRFVQRRDVNAL